MVILFILLGLSIIGNMVLYSTNKQLMTSIQHLQHENKTQEDCVFDLMRQNTRLEDENHRLKTMLSTYRR